MLYQYYVPEIPKLSPWRDYGVDEDLLITTNGNLESVKKALRKRFAKKHEMYAFTPEDYEISLKVKKVKFNDGVKASGPNEYTFEKVDESINNLKLYRKIEERIYNIEEGKEPPECWIGVNIENTLLYMPNGGYFEYEEEWNKFKETVKKNPFIITHETDKRPPKSFCPRRCPEKSTRRILNDKLKPIDDYKYCSYTVYKDLMGIK